MVSSTKTKQNTKQQEDFGPARLLCVYTSLQRLNDNTLGVLSESNCWMQLVKKEIKDMKSSLNNL